MPFPLPVRSIVHFVAGAILTGLIWQILSADSAASDAVQHSEFAGALIQPGDEDGEILRRYEVQLFTTSQTHFYHVIDDARHGCPWPDSFGRTGPDIGTETVQPHLIYDYDGHAYQIAIPPLVVALPKNIEAGATWEQAGWQMTAIEQRSVNNIPAWNVEARERRGRHQTLTVDAADGMTLRAEADVFMGQGDQFKLTLARSSVKPLEQATSASITALQKELLELQTTLKRRPDAHESELSARQIADVASALERLTSLAMGTPLEGLVRQMKTGHYPPAEARGIHSQPCNGVDGYRRSTIHSVINGWRDAGIRKPEGQNRNSAFLGLSRYTSF